MIKKRMFGILVLGLTSIAIFSKAEEKQYISVKEAIEFAVSSNKNIKIAELDRKVANANYHQTDAIFLPQIDLGYTALTTNNPLNAFGFLLQQSGVTAMDFDPDKLNNPKATQNYGASVEAKLPLVNLDMIYARKGAKAQEDLYKYKEERTKEYIEFEVKKAYTQLQFSYLAEDVLQSSLHDVKQIHQSVSNFYDQGLVQKSDVLNAQVQVNTIESALAKAKSNIQNASDGLKLLLGIETKEFVYETDSLHQNLSLNNHKDLSLTRADFMAMNKALDATNMMVKSSKFSFLPRINAFGNYQLNDSKPFGFNADSYLVGINLSWTIFSGNRNRSKVKSYQYQRDKIKQELDLNIKQAQLDLDKTTRDLYDLSLEINKQKSSVQQADEALRIISNRHKEGLVNTTDLLMSQAQLSQQKLMYAQALMSYNITQAYLEFLLETN